jgi:predicted HNH restriction endonuclease
MNASERLITLCAACHARVHRSYVLRNWVADLVVELWREQHPASPIQLQLRYG